MKGFFYRTLILSSRVFGSWLFIIISRFIAAGYFIFSRNTKESYRFYKILYPGKSSFFYRCCTFKQYQNFTSVYFDRLLSMEQELSYTSTGCDLDKAINGEGGILLMSHLGNWEVAAHLLHAEYGNLKLMLYMGIKEKEDIEGIQKENLRQAGIKIIGVDQKSGSPFDVVEGIQFIKSGGLVSLAGDIYWRQEQRTIKVEFLGHYARLPEAPFVFALVSGAPIYIFFTFGNRKDGYHFTLSQPIYIKPENRAERRKAIQQAAQQYADLLAESLRKHPFEWYHFDRFLDQETGDR